MIGIYSDWVHCQWDSLYYLVWIWIWVKCGAKALFRYFLVKTPYFNQGFLCQQMGHLCQSCLKQIHDNHSKKIQMWHNYQSSTIVHARSYIASDADWLSNRKLDWTNCRTEGSCSLEKLIAKEKLGRCPETQQSTLATTRQNCINDFMLWSYDQETSQVIIDVLGVKKTCKYTKEASANRLELAGCSVVYWKSKATKAANIINW